LDVHKGGSETEIRRGVMGKPVSALLFGPPGTSKTGLTKAIAQALGWPLIVINPSKFVEAGLDTVFVKAEEIFEDLGDLSRVVVFFDEMDALTQSRKGAGLDTATQFLTTSMLPQLTKLHDQGRLLFFMATNYQDRFDAAIKRAGRFDLLLCMGPPTLSAKLANVAKFLPQKELVAIQADKARRAISRYAQSDSWVKNQLELYTFDDFKGLLQRFGDPSKIGDSLASLGRERFVDAVHEYSKYVILRLDELGSDFSGELPQWDKVPEERRAVLRETEVGRYLQDRLESKRQY